MFGWIRRFLFTRLSAFLIFVALFAASAYVLGWSSILTVKHVFVVGAPTKIDRTLIAQEVPIGERMARVDKRSVATSLEKYSWLKEAQIERNWIKSSVTIRVKTREPLASIRGNFVDIEGVVFSLPHPEKYDVPTILASSAESTKFAANLIESLPLSFRKNVNVVSIEGLQSATLLMRNVANNPAREITVQWGDASNISLKVRVFKSLLALPENLHIVFMDLSAPHAPIVR